MSEAARERGYEIEIVEQTDKFAVVVVGVRVACGECVDEAEIVEKVNEAIDVEITRANRGANDLTVWRIVRACNAG